MPYGSSKMFVNHWGLQDSETVADVRYSEDDIVAHTAGAPSTRPSDFSLLCEDNGRN